MSTNPRYAVSSFKGNTKTYISAGDTVRHQRFAGRKTEYVTISYFTFDDANGSGKAWVKNADGFAFGISLNGRFEVLSRASAPVVAAKAPKAKVTTLAATPVKFTPVLRKGGGTMWLSVGSTYNIYKRDHFSKKRFGGLEFSKFKVKAIVPKEGFYLVKGTDEIGDLTVATISAPKVTNAGNAWERYFEKQ